MSRTFFVRVNLDDFSAETAALDSTEERGLWLEGFTVGARGHQARETWSLPKKMGHSFGTAAWEQAEELRKAQAEKGRASGASRRKGAVEPELNSGSTEAQPKLDRSSTEVEPDPNRTTNRTRTGPQPDHQPNANLSTIHEPLNTPPTPQGGEGGAIELGDMERLAIAAWDRIAVPAGLPPVGAWNQRRRKAMRSLVSETAAAGVAPFQDLWPRAIEAMAKDSWALSQRVNVDYLLRPDRFQRHLDAWAPTPPREERTVFRAPEPTTTREEREANRKALLDAVPRPGRAP